MSANVANNTATVLTRHATLPAHVVSRQFAEETVILNLRTGFYHGLNVTGGRMLEVVAASPTVGDAAKQLADEYEQPIAAIEEDLAVFCLALVERDLLELSDV
jgi:hypothetical protein